MAEWWLGPTTPDQSGQNPVVCIKLNHACTIDVDECATDKHRCMIRATCMNTLGSYTCSCPDGYTGDGRWFRSGCNGMFQ